MSIPVGVNVAKLVGYAALRAAPGVDVCKLAGYAALVPYGPPYPGVNVGKLVGYAALLAIPPFDYQKISARKLLLTADVQATPNETFADSAFTQVQRFEGAAVAEIAPTRTSNKDAAGKGTSFPTYGQVVGWDTGFKFRCECEPWTLGWALSLVTGSDTVIGSGPYTHTFGFPENTNIAPLTNFYIEDSLAVKTKYPDMAVQAVTFTYAARGAIMMDIEMLGTGRWTDVAIASPPALVTPTYVLNSDTVVSLGPAAHLANFTATWGRVLSGMVKISSGLVKRAVPGGGLYGVDMRLGLPKVSFEFVIAVDHYADDLRTLLINDTLCGLTAVSNSGAASQLKLNFPAFKVKVLRLGRNGENLEVLSISADETTAYNQASAGSIIAQVVNNVPAYLVTT